MRILKMIAYALVITGAIVWGMVGLFNYNLVGAIFGGDSSILSRIVYSLVGISGIVLLAVSGHEECICDCTDSTTGY